MRRVFAAAVAMCLVAVAVAAPVIMIHKEVSESNVVLGGKVEVTTTAMNLGDEPANDFVLEDGETTKNVESFLPNDNVTITTTVDATELGQLPIDTATATWAGEGTARARATSNEIREEERDEKKHAMEIGARGFVNVVTSSEYERLNSRYIKETVLYLLFAAVIVGFPYGVYRQSQLQVDFHIKESRKK